MHAKPFATELPSCGGAWGKAITKALQQPLPPHTARWKRRIAVGSCRRLTVKNGAGEKHQKLDEKVLLLGGNLVPAETLPPVVDIAVADALLDVGVELLFGHGAVLLSGRLLLGPEL